MMKTFFGVLLLIFVGISGQTQSIWSNSITGTDPGLSNPFTSGDIVDANISVSGIGRSLSTAGNAGNDRYNTNGWNAAAIDLNKYLTFTLTPSSTFTVSLINLIYTGQVSGTGPVSFAIRSSVDGYTSNIATPAAAGGTIDLSASVFQNISTSITFRIYAWGASASGGTFSINDFVFNGVVSSTNTIISSGLTSSSFTLANCTSTVSASINFSSTGTFTTGNVYTVQMSNSAGSFAAPVALGSLNSTANSGTINFSIPAGTLTGTGYLIRVVSGNPVVASATSAITVTQNGYCESNATDYFRSKQTGDWSAISTWESSNDNVNWIAATLIPSSSANTITIQSGHTVTINTAVSADQLTINAGATLNHPSANTFTLNDRASETDMIIYGTYIIYGSVPAGAGTYTVESGGVVRANGNSGGTADNIAWSSNTRVLFKTGSVFDWNTSLVFNTSGIIFFPSANGEKPIFRVSSSVGPLGANSNTTINGLLEVNGTLRLESVGLKIFRDGIIGSGSLIQEATSGAFQITGTDAELGGTGTITLNTGGLQITGTANVTMSSDKIINGSTFDFTVNSGGRFNCSTYVVSGTADFILASGGTLGIGSPDGITSAAAGNVQTATRTYSSGANYIYNAGTNQVTGNFTTTPIANTVNALTVANTGSTGNNTVTLTVNNTTASALYLNRGLFAAGTNQTFRIAAGGNIYGNGANNPNNATAGNIEFVGNGTTQGFSTGNPLLYSVILNGSVDFNGATPHSATIMNRLQLNNGSFVTDAPYYQTGSSLIYNTGGTYGRNVEWGSLSNQGYPYHVIVQGNTVLDLNTNAISPARLELAGDLVIGNANGKGQVYLNNNMSKPLSVLGNLTIGSADAAADGSVLQLSSVIGGDLWLNGNFTRYNNSFYTDNSRAIFFKGSVNSSVNTPNISIIAGVPTQNFSYLLMEKNAASNILTLNCPVGITGQITFTTGVISTSATNLLVVESTATSTVGSVSSFVNGPIRKKGGGSFTFPTGVIVGSEYHHRTIGITASGNDGSSYTARFFRSSAGALGPISAVAKANGLQRISRCEYWSLVKDAGSDVGVTLTWTDQSPCNAAYVTAPASIVAVQFNGTQWGDLFGGSGIGNVTAGSVTWTGGPNVYNFFTLGSKDFLENPLPFELSTFKATARKQDIALDWMTNADNDQLEFIIEKSKDGRTFVAMQKVAARAVSATAVYSEFDRQPLNGWNYYRLRAIDKLGKQQLSQIIKVWFGVGQQIRISPNPASEKIRISFSEPSSISEIDIVNISGQVLKHISAVQFNNEINISHLQAGMYYVRISGKNGLTTTSFIKQ